MTKDELIAKQQIEIEELNAILTSKKEALSQIQLWIYRVGGPLNDNCGKFTPKQMVEFQKIANIIDEA